ncbi:MAG: hypothetical protein ACK5YK_02315 [Pseudomonadota bacterium]
MVIAVSDSDRQPSPFDDMTDAELAEIITCVLLPRLKQNLGCKPSSALTPDERERQLHFCLAGIAALKEPKGSPIRVAFDVGLESYFHLRCMQHFESFFRSALQKRYAGAIREMALFILQDKSEESIASLLLKMREEAGAADARECATLVDINPA